MVGALLLTGCGGGSGYSPPSGSASEPSDSSSAASAAPSFVNTTPGEQPPVRPADDLSDDGVKAFAEYWVKTLDWAYATMDTTLLRDASSVDCVVCVSLIDKIDARRSRGETLVGSRIQLFGAVPMPAPVESSNRVVVTVLSYSSLFVGFPDGQLISTAPENRSVQLNITCQPMPEWTTLDVTQVVVK